MTAGQVWRRPDGLRWVEIQADAMDPSGWRLMVPLVGLDDAPDAPPLVVTLGEVRARVHLLTSAHHDDLGEPIEELAADDVTVLQAAARSLIGGWPARQQPGMQPNDVAGARPMLGGTLGQSL